MNSFFTRIIPPDGLRRIAAQAVRGDIFAPTLFLPNGQRRTAALPVNKLILHSNTSEALRRCAAQGFGGTEAKHNKKVPFSPLENKIETDKPHAPFFLKGATPLCGVGPSEGRYYVYPSFCRKITTSLAFKCNHSFALFSLLHFYLLPLVLVIFCMLNPYQSLPVGQ